MICLHFFREKNCCRIEGGIDGYGDLVTMCILAVIWKLLEGFGWLFLSSDGLFRFDCCDSFGQVFFTHS